MPVTLAIVSCNPALEVALERDAQPAPSLVRLCGGSPRSALLLAGADLLLEDAGLAPGDLERVVVSRGPGSFTGIRAGLATAAGLAAAAGVRVLAYDSLTVQAARAAAPGTVWAAQPARRGELYVRRFEVSGRGLPEAAGPIEVLAVSKAGRTGPWLASPAVDLGAAVRATAGRSAAEALLLLASLGCPAQPGEPFYVEGPPVRGGGRG